MTGQFTLQDRITETIQRSKMKPSSSCSSFNSERNASLLSAGFFNLFYTVDIASLIKKKNQIRWPNCMRANWVNDQTDIRRSSKEFQTYSSKEGQ